MPMELNTRTRALWLAGALVMAGWWSQQRALVQPLPALFPMVFNSALCFFLAGTALRLTAGVDDPGTDIARCQCTVDVGVDLVHDRRRRFRRRNDGKPA